MFSHRMSKRHGRDPQPGAGMWGSTQNSSWISDRAVGQTPPGTVPGHGERPPLGIHSQEGKGNSSGGVRPTDKGSGRRKRSQQEENVPPGDGAVTG